MSHSYRDLLKLAFPIILGNLSQMALNLIDTAMVSKLSYVHVASSALVNNIIGFPFVTCMGLTVVISSLVAELRGANKIQECGQLLNNALFLNLLVSSILAMGIYYFGDLIYHLGQDPEVVCIGRPYLNWMLWSIIPMTLFLSIKQFCDGLNHTKVPLLLSLASIPVNAFLNYLLIYGNWGFPRMELEGAGVATFIARALIAILIVAYVSLHPKYAVFGLKEWKPRPEKIKKILRLGLPSAWQYCSEVGAFIVLGIMVGWFGAIQQAAHQISLSVAAFTFMVSIGLSTAGSIKVGEAYGMNNLEMARMWGIRIIRTSMYYGLSCAFLFIVFRNQIPHLFSDQTQVLKHASTLFLFAAAFQLGDSMQAVGIGILRGLQDVRLPTLYTTLCYWFLGIPIGYFLSVRCNWEVSGVWVGFIICLSSMGILLLHRFFKITDPLKRKTSR